MLVRNESVKKFPELHEGLRVKTNDGDDVGKIVQLYDNYFVLEKGIFFPREFTARYDDIRDIQDNVVYLRQLRDELSPWREEQYEGWAQTHDLESEDVRIQPIMEVGETAPKERVTERVAERGERIIEGSDARVPLVEEELQTTKSLKETGRLKIRKVVHTELKHFTIPVMREEIRIERGPATETISSESLSKDKDLFQEESISIPVMEEEVTISKRPVVKEEVHIKKEQVFEQKEISGQVKKEDIEMVEEGQIPKKKAG